MSDFNDRPLVVGSINGLRSFKVDRLGRLTGVSHPKVWTPGENVAECSGYCSTGFLTGGFIVSHATLRAAALGISEQRPSRPEPKPEKPSHAIAGLRQGCGFWAFFDGSNDYYTHGETVAAIVEGYGTVTVGTRGFRAEKARIAALIIPERNPQSGRLFAAWRRFALWADRTPGLVIPVSIPTFVGGVAGSAAMVDVGAFWAIPLLILLAAFAALSCVASFKGIDYRYDDMRSGRESFVDYDRVRRNYADVPVFPSVKAALKAFPVQHPEPPVPPVPVTPETDPNFWTRSAS